MPTHLPFPLVSKRLILREMGRDDTNQLEIYHRDAEFRQYEDADDIHGDAFSKLMAYILDERWRVPRTTFYLAITRSGATQTALGAIFLAIDGDPHGACEIGYVLGRPYWGQGIVTEAAHMMLGFAFDTLSVQRVYADCNSENKASIRVLEKIGLGYEKTIPDDLFFSGRWWDVVRYEISYETWQARNAQLR